MSHTDNGLAYSITNHGQDCAAMRGQDGHGGTGGVLSRRPSDKTMVQSSEVHLVHSVAVVLPGIVAVVLPRVAFFGS